MAGKTIETVHGVTVEAPALPGEENHKYHAESAGHVEQNVGLRVDGDDLDHEHEPRVRYASNPECEVIVLTSFLDDLEAIHEFTGNGFVVDW